MSRFSNRFARTGTRFRRNSFSGLENRTRPRLEILEGRWAPACTLSGQTVNCDAGNDQVEVYISSTTIVVFNYETSLGLVSSGTVTVNGGGGTNSLAVNDAQYSGAETYTVTSSQIIIGSFLTTNYTGFNSSLRLDAANGSPTSNDTIYVNSTPASTTLTVNGGSGSDTMHVTYSSGNLNSLGGHIYLHGDGGTDSLTVWDDFYNGTGSISISEIDVQRASAPVTLYDSIAAVTVNAGSSGTYVYIDGTAAGATTTVNAGGGNDTIIVPGTFGYLMKSVLNGTLTINGQAGTDKIVVYDLWNTAHDTCTLTSNSITFTDVPTISYGTTEELELYLGEGNNTVNINSTFTGGPTTVYAGHGNDTVSVTFPSGNLGSLGGPLTVNGGTLSGGSGTDSLTLWDDLVSHTGTYTINDASVLRTGAQTTGHDNFQNLTVNASSGHNTLNINSTPSGGTTTVNAGGGNDIVHVAQFFHNLIDLGGPFTVNGQAGTDSVFFYDDLNANPDTYTLSNSSLLRSGAQTTTYGTMESLTLNASTGQNIININGTLAGGSTTVNSGSGNDAINVAQFFHNLIDLGGPLTVNGQAGTDSVAFFDDLNGNPDTYTLNNSSLLRTGAQTTTYGTMESLTLNASTSQNIININGTLAGGSTTVNAGGGNDAINVAQFFHNLIDLGGPITVNGQAGTDSVVFYDDLNGNPDTYTVNSSSLLRTGAQTTIYGTMESMTLNAGTSQNTININGTLAGGPTTINAGSGNDVIPVAQFFHNLNDLGGDLTINGQAGTDTAIAYDYSNAGNDLYTITATLLARTNAPLVTYGTTENLTVFAGSGSSDVRINGTPTGGTTNVDAGPGDDDIDVTFTSGNLEQLGGPLTVSGGAGTDDLILFDNLHSGNVNYTVSSTSVTRTGAQTTTYNTMESFTANASSGANLVDISSTIAEGPTTFNAGGGNDGIEVTPLTQNLSSLGSPLTVNGEAGTDSVDVYDSLNVNSDTFTVSAFSVTRTGAQTTTFGTIEALFVQAGSGNNKFDMVSTLEAGPTTLQGGDGNDTFNLTPTSSDLGNLNGPLTLNGQAGANTINAKDQQNADGTTYTVASSGTGAGALGVPADSVSISFHGIGVLNLYVRPKNKNNVDTSGYNPAHFELNVIWRLLNDVMILDAHAP